MISATWDWRTSRMRVLSALICGTEESRNFFPIKSLPWMQYQEWVSAPYYGPPPPSYTQQSQQMLMWLSDGNSHFTLIVSLTSHISHEITRRESLWEHEINYLHFRLSSNCQCASVQLKNTISNLQDSTLQLLIVFNLSNFKKKPL